MQSEHGSATCFQPTISMGSRPSSANCSADVPATDPFRRNPNHVCVCRTEQREHHHIMCQPNTIDPTATLAAQLDSNPHAQATHTAMHETLLALAEPGDTPAG